MTCYVRTHKNRKYANDSVVPFVGHYTDKQGNTQSRFMYIYEIHCIKTNQYYIGQHTCRRGCKDPLKELYKGSGSVITKLRHEFDWYNDFTFTILQFCDNNQQLAEAEYQLILEHLNDRLCLNQLETKQLIDLDIQNQKLKSRKILNLTTGVLYESCAAASRDYNVGMTTIINACKLHQRSCGCFWWFSDKQLSSYERCRLIERLEGEMRQRIDYNQQNRHLMAKQKCSHKIRIVETNETYDSIRDIIKDKHWNSTMVYEAIACGLDYKGYHFQYVNTPLKHIYSNRKVVNITTKTVYDDIHQASKLTGIRIATIKLHINSHTPINNQYWVWFDEFNGDYAQTELLLSTDYNQRLTVQYNHQQQGLKRYQNSIKKRVQCVETGEVFDSVTSATKHIGYSSQRHLIKHLRSNTPCKDHCHYKYCD